MRTHNTPVRICIHGAGGRMGRALIEAGRPAEALAPLDQAALLAPRMGLPWFEKARAFLRLGREEEARAAVRQALRVEPTIEALLSRSPELERLR